MVTPPSSQRCVILMTFSTEKVKDNPEYRQAMLFLNDLDEEKVRKLHVDNVRKVEDLTREGNGNFVLSHQCCPQLMNKLCNIQGCVQDRSS